eukprot:5169155-Prymnesium_polylepis.1
MTQGEGGRERRKDSNAMESSGEARPGEAKEAGGRAESAERRAAPERRIARGRARRNEQRGKSTSR